jgi:hypothetical protein
LQLITQQMTTALPTHPTVATADQWNWAYRQVTGQGLDEQYGFNFDVVYGPVATRANDSMTAIGFILRAHPQYGISGLSAMTTGQFPVVRNLTYWPA